MSFDWTVDASFNFSPATGVNDPVDSDDDLIYAGSGDDIVWAGSGDDILFGGPGADILIGHQGNDIINGDEWRVAA